MIANALPPKWIVSRIYTLKEGNAPDGRPIRDLFLEMTTAEAQFYNAVQENHSLYLLPGYRPLPSLCWHHRYEAL